MLQTAVVAVRDRARLQEIVGTLLRFGLTDVVQTLGLSRWAQWGLSEAPDDAPSLPQSRPERVRLAIEALGPTFVKLGQILSTRSDLLPTEWTQALEQLQTQAQPLPWETMQPHIESLLGMPVSQAFHHFDPEPLASASMAQVYRASVLQADARLRHLVVKVQRPGIRASLEADARLMRHMAAVLEERFSPLRRYRPTDVARQVSAALQEELDFTIEGQHNESVAKAFATQSDIVIPGIVWDLSGPEILVQDWLDGVPANQAAELPQFDHRLLAQRGAQAFLQMVLRDGLFHADPHPGNVFALAANRVGFLDFGLVGHLSPHRRDQFLMLLRAIVDNDADGLLMIVLEWSGDAHCDIARLESAVERYIGQRQAQTSLSLSSAILQLMTLAREAEVPLPSDMALLFKALVTADRVLLQLDPSFDVIATVRPMVTEQIKARYAPQRLLREKRAAMAQLYELASDLPQTLRLLMYRLKQGRVAVDMDIHHLERLSGAVERAATRLALAVVAGAFVLGMGPSLRAWDLRLWGLPVFPILGGLGAVASLAVLVLTMRRQKALQ